jgi:hypothetical protein
MDLSMIRGDSRTFAFPLTDASGPIDLTNCSVWMTAKEYYTDTDDSATFQKSTSDGITVLDEDNGLIKVELEPADTTDLDGKRHRLVYDIQVEDSAGAVTTVLRGRLTVYPDVTVTTETS